MISWFKAGSYGATAALVKAETRGSPQRRWRMYLVAWEGGDIATLTFFNESLHVMQIPQLPCDEFGLGANDLNELWDTAEASDIMMTSVKKFYNMWESILPILNMI